MPITDHRPQPGPAYWDFKCLRCDHPVDEHRGRLRSFLARLADSVRGRK